MKKHLIIGACILLCLTLAACSSGNNGETTLGTVAPDPEFQGAHIGQVVYDRGDIRVIAVGITPSSFLGPSITFDVENNSETGVVVQMQDCSVNGLMMESSFSCHVASGAFTRNVMSIQPAKLDAATISVVQTVEFVFQVLDAGTFTVLDTSEPIAMTVTEAPDYVQTFPDGGFTVHDGDGLRIKVQRREDTGNFPGSDIYVYIENNTSSIITVQAVDVSVNSFVADPHFSSRIAPGKVAYAALNFPASAPADSADITDLKMRFLVLDPGTQETVLDTGLKTIVLE